MTNLELIKKLTGCTDDDLLTALLQDATDTVLAMTGRTHTTNQLDCVIRELVICNYNKLGSEGMQSRQDAEVGISSTFEVPHTLQQKINRLSLVRVGGVYHEKDAASVEA